MSIFFENTQKKISVKFRTRSRSVLLQTTVELNFLWHTSFWLTKLIRISLHLNCHCRSTPLLLLLTSSLLKFKDNFDGQLVQVEVIFRIMPKCLRFGCTSQPFPGTKIEMYGDPESWCEKRVGFSYHHSLFFSKAGNKNFQLRATLLPNDLKSKVARFTTFFSNLSCNNKHLGLGLGNLWTSRSLSSCCRSCRTIIFSWLCSTTSPLFDSPAQAIQPCEISRSFDV